MATSLIAGLWREYARRIRRGIRPGYNTGPAVDAINLCADCAEQLADDIDAVDDKLAGRLGSLSAEHILKKITEESP